LLPHPADLMICLVPHLFLVYGFCAARNPLACVIFRGLLFRSVPRVPPPEFWTPERFLFTRESLLQERCSTLSLDAHQSVFLFPFYLLAFDFPGAPFLFRARCNISFFPVGYFSCYRPFFMFFFWRPDDPQACRTSNTRFMSLLFLPFLILETIDLGIPACFFSCSFRGVCSLSLRIFSGIFLSLNAPPPCSFQPLALALIHSFTSLSNLVSRTDYPPLTSPATHVPIWFYSHHFSRP